MSTAPTFEENVAGHIRAGHQILLVPTTEEARVMLALEAAARACNLAFARWDSVLGLGNKKCINATELFSKLPEAATFEAVHTMVAVRDVHPFFDDPFLRRTMKAGAEGILFNNNRMKRPVVLLQPTAKVHPDLAPYVTVLDFPLPTVEQLGATFEKIRGAIQNVAKRTVSDQLRYQVVHALRGLTSTEADNCLALCVIRHGGFVPDMIDTIEEQKAAMIRRSDVLSYVPRDQVPPVEDIGGFEEVLNFVRRKSMCYGPEAAAVGLDNPKGMVLVGVPGTAKSVGSMAVARLLRLPLLEFDFSKIFSSLVGASEAKLRDVIALVTALDGCVLVVDEADKALGGAAEASGDSGVTRRLFGMFLSWLARKKDKTFVVMNLNRTAGMPPELLRKGRFDEIFCTDLPTDREVRTIFEIHMRRRGIDPALYTAAEWKKFVRDAAGFVGAEIEEAVKAARETAFQTAFLRRLIDRHRAATGAAREELDAQLRPYSAESKSEAVDVAPELLEQLGRAVPTAAMLTAAIKDGAVTRLGRVDSENIEAIRKFCQERARPASAERRLAQLKAAGRNVDVEAN